MKYHYSSYWHTWSRVLSENAPGGPILEVNLTPIPCSDRTWENDVLPVVLRLHGTSPGRGDKFTDELPEEVETQMLLHLPAAIYMDLVAGDLLDRIDLDLLRAKMRGGGISITACGIDRYRPNPDGSVTLITPSGGEHTYDPDQLSLEESPCQVSHQD